MRFHRTRIFIAIERPAAASLLSSWTISDKASLLETVSGLCGDKGHNTDALSVLKRYGSDPSESRYAFISSLAGDGVSETEEIYMLAAYDARAAFGDRALMLMCGKVTNSNFDGQFHYSVQKISADIIY